MTKKTKKGLKVKIKNKTMSLLELSEILASRKTLVKKGSERAERDDTGTFQKAFLDMFDCDILANILERNGNGEYTGVGTFANIDGDNIIVFEATNQQEYFVGLCEPTEAFDLCNLQVKVLKV